MQLLRKLFQRKQTKAQELSEALSSLDEEQAGKLLTAIKEVQQTEDVQGDGNAAFLEPMTDEEYAKWMHEQEHGWKAIYDKILRRD